MKKDKLMGIQKQNGDVVIVEFCPDPDGTDLIWYKEKLGAGQLNLKDYEMIGQDDKNYSGKCDNTAEYTSHMGEMMQDLFENAPRNATLVIFKLDSGSGTITFSEKVSVTYYKNI